MSDLCPLEDLEVGYDVPAKPGMPEDQIQTPCLVLDLDALERNVRKLGELAQAGGVRHRAHGKMHKSVDVALLQERLGGSQGVCCQKVSEAEAFVRGGIRDVLVTNQVRDPGKLDRLARLPGLGARVACCVDDLDGVADLSTAAAAQGAELGCLIELDVGAARCGVTEVSEAVAIARAIDAAPALRFEGLQAYQGSMQHLPTLPERQQAFDKVSAMVGEVLAALESAGLSCETVTGAGTGSFRLEMGSGLYTEIQCGSYAFMDADYGRIRGDDGQRLDDGDWENALFVLTSVMSTAGKGRAVCDAGHKSHAIDSGLPVIFGRDDIEYVGCSDDHGVIRDPGDSLQVNDRLRLVPGHCDPTCNLHDWYVGLRGGVVECVWPVSARGKLY
jgi:3-hydroxy-D-aspartate aldolase